MNNPDWLQKTWNIMYDHMDYYHTFMAPSFLDFGSIHDHGIKTRSLDILEKLSSCVLLKEEINKSCFQWHGS